MAMIFILFIEAIDEIRHLMDSSTQFYAFDLKIDKNRTYTTTGNINLDILLMASSAKPLPSAFQCLDFADKLLYIYTSGTTGLPKAVYPC